ncbi:venom metalloproteinase antarease-like TfasMP_A [Amblyomma americanum]
MTHPKIRLQLNQVVTNVSDKVINKTENGVDIHTALYKMEDLAQIGAFNRCDVAFLLSSEDMFRVIDSTYIEKRVMGMTYIGGVCKEYKVAVAEDKPHTYEGVLTLAHELAHLLGADHDNASGEDANMTGYPGSQSCPWEDGYLMSYVGSGRNKHRLSNCSKEQIRFVFKTLPRSCVEMSAAALFTTTSYPGQNMTRRQFCQTMHSGNFTAKPYQKHHKRHKNCKIKCCWRGEEGWLWCEEHNMPEGLKCAPGKTCRRGVCARHAWK